MTRKLTVKKEIRTLGIDLCNPRRTVGAIARGGSLLDGITLLPFGSAGPQSLGPAIRRSKFFPELRTIMIHDPRSRLDARIINKMTKLPIIEVRSKGRPSSDGYMPVKIGRKQLWVRTSLPAQVAREVLSTTWTAGALPEPLRIAHLVAGSRFFREKSPFLG